MRSEFLIMGVEEGASPGAPGAISVLVPHFFFALEMIEKKDERLVGTARFELATP